MYGIYRRISGFLLPNMWATSNSRWFLGANVGTHPKWTNGLNTQNSGTHDWISFGRFSDTSKPISNNLGTLRPKLWHTPIIHEENPTHPKTSKKHLETIINHQHPSAILHHFMAFCPVFAHLFMVVSASSVPPPAVWVAAPPSAAPAAATATPASKPRPLWAQRRGGSWWSLTSSGDGRLDEMMLKTSKTLGISWNI